MPPRSILLVRSATPARSTSRSIGPSRQPTTSTPFRSTPTGRHVSTRSQSLATRPPRGRARRARLPRQRRRPTRHDCVAGHRPCLADLHRWENLMTKRLDPKLARGLQEEAARAEAAAEADSEAEFPTNASVTWPNRSRMLTLRLRQSEYDAIQRAAEQRHLPASTLARSLLLDKLGEQHAS